MSWGVVLCTVGDFTELLISTHYISITSHAPVIRTKCLGGGVQSTSLDIRNSSYKVGMIFSRNWNNLSVTGAWNVKWELALNQASFIPYLENPVNYFGLYLKSTGKLAKLVNDRVVWFRYMFRKYQFQSSWSRAD